MVRLKKILQKLVLISTVSNGNMCFYICIQYLRMLQFPQSAPHT